MCAIGDLASRQAVKVRLHSRGQDRRQRLIRRSANVQRRLRVLRGVRRIVRHKNFLVLPVQLARAVPVQCPVEGVTHVLLYVQIHLLLAKQRCVGRHPVKLVEVEPFTAGVEGRRPVAQRHSVDAVQDLPHARGVLRVTQPDVVRYGVGAELLLVVERRHRHGLVDVGDAWSREGRAKDEEGGDQVWVIQGCAVDDCTAPVVSAEDDA